MDEKKRERQRKYQRAWYYRNREKRVAQIKEYKKRMRVEWQEYKAAQKCSQCHVSHPAIIDFHHIVREGKNKKSVNELANQGMWGEAKREAEEKCVPLCSNCHRILHWNESRPENEDE